MRLPCWHSALLHTGDKLLIESLMEDVEVSFPNYIIAHRSNKENNMKRSLIVMGLCLTILGCQSTPKPEIGRNLELRELATAQKLESLRTDPAALTQFLKTMPKGADLHNHLSGAVTTERLIEWAIADNLCVDPKTWTAGSCKLKPLPIAKAATDKALYQTLLSQWSMDKFQGPLLAAHQHFFDAFGKFSAVLSDERTDDAIADVLATAGKHHQMYVELMQGFGASQVSSLGEKYLPASDAWTEANLLEKRKQIIADPLFRSTLTKNAANLKIALEGARKLLSCDKPAPDLGCEVEVRFLVSANRTKDRGAVFAQWVYGYELAQATPLVVGVELVSPEEAPNSLRYYDDEMYALNVLQRFNQADASRTTVHIALHAGELIPEVLPATPAGQAHLKYHIRQAIEVANAERIGHGTNVLEDEKPLELLQLMREKNVLAEICLTSNFVLLGKSGSSHPVNTYLEHNVPAALATDDEGILRNNITDEFVRAVTVQHLEYPALKKMVRSSLEHSFLPGASLWKIADQFDQVADACAGEVLGSAKPAEACAHWLNTHKRAAMQWKLESKFNTFENTVTPQL
jgi:adenosine deaminase